MIDHNCDGLVHEGAKDFVVLYYDEDQDGYGAESNTVEACAPYWPWVDNKDDCDDTDADTNPGVLWYEDADGDGYGNPDSSEAFEPVSGYVTNSLIQTMVTLMLLIVDGRGYRRDHSAPKRPMAP